MRVVRADGNIPALVKSLRTRLGLTQEQLAHEVGVTFGTVNQWENGRRRPQPYLLKRLEEMDASLNRGGTRLTRAAARAFRKRWQAVNAAAIEELRATSMAQKFCQLAALMASASEFPWPEFPAAETDQVRDRWQRLRKAYHG